MNLSMTENLDDSFEGYQQSVRDRASGSIYGLRRTLDRGPAVSPDAMHRMARARSPGSSPSPWEKSRNTDHSDYTYGAAVDKLRESLRRAEPRLDEPKTVQFSQRPHGLIGPLHETQSYMQDMGPRIPRGDIPSAEETVSLLQNQAVVVQQLEAENKYCREELQALKQKMREVIEENRALHEEIKRGTVQDILQEGIDIPGLPRSEELDVPLQAPDTELGDVRALSKLEYKKWHKEIERVRVLHTAKTTRLEAQLAHAKEEQAAYEKEVEELRSKVRMLESLSTADPNLLQLAAGLCMRCAQNEAVLAPSGVAGPRQMSVDRLTKERDELVEQLTALKARYQEVRGREEEAYLQVKGSVQLAEQAQLEMTQALVEREQLKEELHNMRERLGQHVEELQNKMQQERELVRAETARERDDLHKQLKELGEKLAESQGQVERLSRDKINLMTEVDAKKGQIHNFDDEFGKATDSMKMSMTQATVERNAAVGHVRRLKQEMDQMQRDRDNERVRLKTELEDLRRRLHEAERELVEAKEECIQLHSTTQALEREAHLAKMAKESVEKNRSDDLKAMMKRAEQREVELNIMIDTLEQRNEHSSNELEGIVNSQGSLVQRLREECRKLAGQLEDITRKYKGDNKRLKTHNEYLRTRMEKALRRQQELEDCTTRHGQLQDKMRERLKQMDAHAGHNSQQILDLLAKESSLMRDRHLLASEVEFLRRQLSAGDGKDSSKSHSASRHMVDDILNNVRYEQELKEREIVEKTPNVQSLMLDSQNVEFTSAKNAMSEKEESIDTPTEEEIDLE